MTKQFRQGDVYLVEIEKLPPGSQHKPHSDRIVLAYGEATGHTHSVSALDARFYDNEGQDYLVIDDIAQLIHEEHSTIVLPAGVYKVVRQREYEPITGMQYVGD